EPGTYTVTHTVNDGAEQKTIKNFIQVYGPSCYVDWLTLVDSSAAYPGEGWSNAIDGDTDGWDGTVTAEDADPAYAVFKFGDGRTRVVTSVKLLTDTRVGEESRWVTRFRVYTSVDSVHFDLLLDAQKNGGGWQEWEVSPTEALYLKLEIVEPASGLKQIGEFQVCADVVLPDADQSTITATSPHYASGTDASLIRINLVDENGNPIPGKSPAEFHLWTNTGTGVFSDVLESETPGEYVATYTTTEPGTREIRVTVNGAVIRYSVPGGPDVATVEFLEPPTTVSSLELIDSGPAFPGETWENAIDGDTEGWDGTVTAQGNPPWAIFGFQDRGTKKLYKIRLMCDTGVGYESRWVRHFRVQVSSTGIADADFVTVVDAKKNGGDWEEFVFPATDAKYVKLILDDPTSGWRQIGEFEVYETTDETAATTGVRDNLSLARLGVPTRDGLDRNYPNPFNPTTTIRFHLSAAKPVTLRILNAVGQVVRIYEFASLSAGYHEVVWDARDQAGREVPSGVYFVRIETDRGRETTRMLLLK
ncbi:MAG: T9SS type A sorting domain-containing protein, partial [Calditrichaeota bacterium]|nr:T9SS type A sorting domain-containing protein [Calditrichota bacterium]